MQAAHVIGNVTTTVKHASLAGWRLLVLQPVDIHNAADGFPFLAIDNLGAGVGEMVFFTSDGKSIRSLVGRDDCPIRYAVQGIIDNQNSDDSVSRWLVAANIVFDSSFVTPRASIVYDKQ